MPFGPTTSTHANVASSATEVTIFSAAGNAVEGRSVFNDSTAVLYLKKGTGVSATSHFVQLAAGAYFEFPVGRSGPWPGVVTGLWASANGAARTSEDS